MVYVLKIGGVVITDKNSYAVAKVDVIERIAKEIASAKKRHVLKLVVVNGAGSFGHAPVVKYGLQEGIKTREHVYGVTRVHRHVEDLNRKLWEFLDAHGVTAAPVHPMSFVLAEGGKFAVDIKIIREMLKHDITPLLYGDIVLDTLRGSTIVSGDDIAPMIGAALKAERILIGSNVNGIYDGDPKKDKGVKHIPEITDANWQFVLKQVGGSSALDVTGGMQEKLRKLVEYAKGIECLIYDAELPGTTERVLAGEMLGTRIRVSA